MIRPHNNNSRHHRFPYFSAGLFLALGVGAFATVKGWGFEPLPSAAEPVANAKKTGHTPPKEMLARTLHRLHRQALVHFYADPTNGLRRMPVVYTKVVSEWQEPYFSPGEVDIDKPIPFLGELANIHTDTLGDFLNPKRSANEKNKFIFPRNYNFKNWQKDKKVWEAKSVDLVGLLKNPDPVVYISEQLPAKPNPRKAPTRYLDTFELAGLDALEAGQDLFARTDKGIVRLLGAVRANTTCLKCHKDKKAGDLLGAFSYTLRQAEYRPRTARRGIHQFK